MTESFVLPETEESENAPCTNTPLAARGFDSLKESTGVEYARARTVPSHPTRGITLRNAPRRNPTCATVSPHRAPRTCGPARRRDGSSRQARAKPKRSRIDGNRRESSVPMRGQPPGKNRLQQIHDPHRSNIRLGGIGIVPRDGLKILSQQGQTYL